MLVSLISLTSTSLTLQVGLLKEGPLAQPLWETSRGCSEDATRDSHAWTCRLSAAKANSQLCMDSEPSQRFPGQLPINHLPYTSWSTKPKTYSTVTWHGLKLKRLVFPLVEESISPLPTSVRIENSSTSNWWIWSKCKGLCSRHASAR